MNQFVTEACRGSEVPYGILQTAMMSLDFLGLRRY